MGNQQTSGRRQPGISDERELTYQTEQFRKNTKDKPMALITPDDLAKLQKQVAFEYPMLTNVNESMLVCDNRMPDCPIVLVNDDFERMSLYSKEQILGINCRFMQGKYTDKKVVSSIRAAVDGGRPIEVEILNYRRDGVPFWNCFLMLPVHARGKKSGKVHYFIAIQKDVTLIKGLGENVVEWSSPEVGMWMERHNLGHLSERMVQENIDGERLLELTPEDLAALGVLLSSERKRFLAARDRDIQNGRYRHADTGGQRLAAEVQQSRFLDEGGQDQVKPLAFWGKNTNGDDRLAFKCHTDGHDPLILLLPRKLTYAQLSRKLRSKLGRTYKQIETADPATGARQPLSNDQELSQAVRQQVDGTVPLYLSRGRFRIQRETRSYLEIVSSPIVCVDVFGDIVFLNFAAIKMFGTEKIKELVGLPISRVLPKVNPRALPPVGRFSTQVLIGSGRSRPGFVTVQLGPKRTRVFTLDTVQEQSSGEESGGGGSSTSSSSSSDSGSDSGSD